MLNGVSESSNGFDVVWVGPVPQLPGSMREVRVHGVVRGDEHAVPGQVGQARQTLHMSRLPRHSLRRLNSVAFTEIHWERESSGSRFLAEDPPIAGNIAFRRVALGCDRMWQPDKLALPYVIRS